MASDYWPDQFFDDLYEAKQRKATPQPNTVAVDREILEDWAAAMLSSDEGERRSMRDAIRALLDQEPSHDNQ